MSPLAAASLWAGVVAIGLYHGLNPAMGWPLAVANGLERQRGAAVFATWLPLGAGHLLAMALVLLPFALLASLLPWGREIRIGVGLLVLAFGAWRLARPGRHRWSRRLRPTQLTLWSFLMASAHGAAFLLLPSALGRGAGGAGAPTAPGGGVAEAALVATVHTLAMLASGLLLAWLAYRVVGPGLIGRSWLNLDLAWGASLVLAGLAGVAPPPR